MGCTTCGGAGGYGMAAVIPTPRQAMPGADGLVLVEWQGDAPMVMHTSQRDYVFTEDRRRLYMTVGDYAAAAASVDGIVIVSADPQGPPDPATPLTV